MLKKKLKKTKLTYFMREDYLVQNTITDASTPLNLNAELHLQNRKVQPYA